MASNGLMNLYKIHISLDLRVPFNIFACFQNMTLSELGDLTLVVQNQDPPIRLHSFTLKFKSNLDPIYIMELSSFLCVPSIGLTFSVSSIKKICSQALCFTYPFYVEL